MPTVNGTVTFHNGSTLLFSMTGSINATYGTTQSTYSIQNVTATTGTARAVTGAGPDTLSAAIMGRPASGVTGRRITVQHTPANLRLGIAESYVITLRK